MSAVTDDRWSCPGCHRTVIITGSEHDTRAAIEAVRDRHRRMHAATAMPRQGAR